MIVGLSTMLDNITLGHDDIEQIDRPKVLRFSNLGSADAVKKQIEKAKTLGIKATRLSNNVYALENNKEVTVIAPDKIGVYNEYVDDYGDTIHGAFIDSNFTEVYLDNTIIEGVNTFDNTVAKDMYQFFYTCNNLKKVDFTGCDTSHIESMLAMFYHCSNLEYVNFGDINTDKLIDIAHMFSECINLKKIDNINRLNTSKITDASEMFLRCENLTELDISDLDFSNLRKAVNMFRRATKLKYIHIPRIYTVDNFDFYNMFSDCKSIEKISLPNLNFAKSEEQNYISMFRGCNSLKELNINKLDKDIARLVEYAGLPRGVRVIHNGHIEVT